MIKVTIGAESVVAENFDLQWLHALIDARRRAGADASVLVEIKADDVDLTLRAPARPGRGSSRELSKAEEFIIERWLAGGLNDDGFSVDALYNFLRVVRGFS